MVELRTVHSMSLSVIRYLPCEPKVDIFRMTGAVDFDSCLSQFTVQQQNTTDWAAYEEHV